MVFLLESQSFYVALAELDTWLPSSPAVQSPCSQCLKPYWLAALTVTQPEETGEGEEGKQLSVTGGWKPHKVFPLSKLQGAFPMNSCQLWGLPA